MTKVFTTACPTCYCNLRKISNRIYYPKDIPSAAFFETLYTIFGWNTDYKYRIIGTMLEQDGEIAYVFNASNSEAFFKPYVLPSGEGTEDGAATLQPLTPIGKRIRAIPEEWTRTFGRQFYEHERKLSEIESQSEQDWKLRLEGRLFETGEKLNVTGFEELRAYIKQELSTITMEETANE